MKNWLVVIFLAALLSGCASNNNLVTQPADRADQVNALVRLGMGYIRNGDYARAKDNLNHALELDSRSAKAHDGLALVFQLEREFDEAEKQFKLALRYDSKFTRARNNYGAFLFSQGRYKEAINQLTIAAKDQFYDGRPTVFENLGISYQKLGDDKDAESAFVRSVALNPRQPRALLELAEIRYGQKQYAAARNLYARYERVAKDNARSLLLCVQLARVFTDNNREASCALALKNIYPASPEYKEYQQTFGSK